jgi:hypothetical protein
MKEKIICRSLFTAQWKILAGKFRDRCKIPTSPCKSCDVANVIDLAEGA